MLKPSSSFFTYSLSSKRIQLLIYSLLLLSACLISPHIILNTIISSAADFNRNGWWMHFYSPSRPVGVDGYKTFIPGGEPIALNPDFTRSTGYTVWDVPEKGQYIFKLVAREDATLAVDGRVIAKIKGNDSPIQRVDEWVSLTKGLHLFQVKLNNSSGKGGYSVGMMVPPTMINRLMEGEDVAAPQLVGLNFWWLLITLLYKGKFLSGFLVCIFLLSLLLPVTLSNRRISVMILATVTIIPALIIPAKSQREPYVGEMVHKKLRDKDPDFVFIGNSMLSSRIDDDHLEMLLNDKKVYSIVNFGGLSAVHYLSLKYLLAPAGITPKKVFILFRGNQFHLPRMRTVEDPFVLKIVERLTPSADPVYEKIIYGKTRSATEIVYDNILRLFPVSSLQERIRKTINNLAFSSASLLYRATGQPADLDELRRKTNARFSFTNSSFRSNADSETTAVASAADSYDFDAGIGNSFLPHMLDVAQENNLTLVFIRVQERPSGNGPVTDPPMVRNYMTNLEKYLTQHGAYFYDFTGDPELPLSEYHDGDHIRDAKKYTELFFRRMGDLLR